jgi:hypothetical protein
MNMTQKTVVIWDNCGAEPIRFAVIDRDVSHLDGAYLNAADNDSDKEDELLVLFCSEPSKVDLLEAFPVDAVKDGAKVITAGFLP